MIVVCKHCGRTWEIENNDPDVIIEPWPHIVCACGRWIPLF
jgi:hypothetical protein